MIWKFSSNFL